MSSVDLFAGLSVEVDHKSWSACSIGGLRHCDNSQGNPFEESLAYRNTHPKSQANGIATATATTIATIRAGRSVACSHLVNGSRMNGSNRPSRNAIFDSTGCRSHPMNASSWQENFGYENQCHHLSTTFSVYKLPLIAANVSHSSQKGSR
jgi:hypothetical protein